MGGWPMPGQYPPKDEISVDQMLKDAWDEDFRYETGEYPECSRLHPSKKRKFGPAPSSRRVPCG